MQPVNAITFSEGGLQSTVSLGDRQHGGHRASVAGHMCEYSKRTKERSFDMEPNPPVVKSKLVFK